MLIIETIATTLPVILIVCLGILLQKSKLIRSDSIADIKILIVNITLPFLLFKAFATMQFEIRFLTIIAIVFLACIIVLWISSKMPFVPGLKSKYSAYLMAGFEAGMLGYAVFGSIYGEGAIPKMAVIDLGQVLFVFLVLIPRLEYQQSSHTNIRQTIISTLKTPVIIAIALGILTNLTGIQLILNSWPLSASVLHAVEMVAALTAPLVALVIGYELHFHPNSLIQSLQTVVLRLCLWVALALGFNYFVIHGLLGLDRTFEAAVMLMAILPAPFVVPLYLRKGEQADRDYILNTLSIEILVTLFGSIFIKMLY